ncbi:unnamed protein product [Moneuplotes crassus]|uniref:Rhodanese domain-containing protein n=1 Tax=Euplotes crassus TaxID=5936 RepID=A0AAD1XQ09_EUPCR|nr:unnamed protein product [Moneuplotes crassus]
MESQTNLLIETEQLAELIQNNPEGVKLVCGTWNLGADAMDPKEQFNEAHIEGSVYFNLQEIADTSSGFLATWPSEEFFISEMKRLGIRKDQTIVLYDHINIFSVCRPAYMLRAFGAKDVRVLNGCLKKWIDEGRKVSTGYPKDVNDTSEEGYDYELVKDSVDFYESTFEKVAAAEKGETDDYEFVDVRNAANFEKGTPPGFKNSFCFDYVTADKSTFKSKEEIEKQLLEDGVDVNKHIVFSCGAGVTACISELAARIAGAQKTSIYDGSYQEYCKKGRPECLQN